jgi:hypothetical protein
MPRLLLASSSCSAPPQARSPPAPRARLRASRIDSLAPNPAAGGARDWPIVDSLGKPMGRLRASDAGRFELVALDGTRSMPPA